MVRRVAFSSWTIRSKLVVLVLVVFLPAAAVIVLSGAANRTQEISTAKNEALLLVQGLAAQQEEIADGTRQLLGILAQTPEVQSLKAEACNDLFRKIAIGKKYYSNFALDTPDGNMIAGLNPFEPGTVNLSDRNHIRRVLQEHDFSVGDYVVGRTSKLPSIHYSYPVLDGNNNLLAILSAGFRLDDYARFIRKANLPEGSAVLITDRNGVRLYRFPEDDGAIGTPIREDTLKRISGDSVEGIYEGSGHEGVPRVYAFEQIRLREGSEPYLYILVGIPRDQILQSANRHALFNSLTLGLAVFVAFSLARFLANIGFIKPIKQLVVATEQLGHGNSGARTGLSHSADELGNLANSFDTMASLLEKKEMERNRAEDEMRRMHRQNRLILEAAGEGIVGLDEGGTITFSNPAACELLGYGADELIGNKLHELVHGRRPDGSNYPAADCPMYDTLKNGVPCHIRDEVLWRKDGTGFQAAYSSMPIMEDGKITGAVITFRDISARKKAVDLLQESEERHRQISDMIADFAFSYVKSAEGQYIIDWLAGAVERITGYTTDEVLQRGCLKFLVSPADTAVFENNVIGLESGMSKGCELRIVRKDGTSRWMRVLTKAIEGNANLSSHRLIGSCEDITEGKRAEEALRESEEKYRSIFENSLDGVLFASPDGPVYAANITACELFGRSEEEILECGRDMLVDETDPRWQRLLEDRRLTGRVRGELNYRKKDGTTFPVEVSSSLFTMQNGDVRTCVVFRDITERKEAEKLKFQLQQAQKLEAIGTLAGGIAHDFNNILAIILGYTEIALMDIQGNSSSDRSLREVLRATHRAKDLIQQILTFSRQGEVEVRQPMEVAPVTKETLKLLRATLPSTIEFREEIPADSLLIMGDPTQLHQVLVNLCTNSAHAMRDRGGLLEVRLAEVVLDTFSARTHEDLKPGPYVRLTVKDTGHGMDAATLERIFDPYFTTKKVGEGSGLGLAVVHGIVKRHEGGIYVRSEPGVGTEFGILFPKIQEVKEERPIGDVQSPGGTERILFVDDEEQLAAVTERMLAKLGYSVTAKTSSIDAIELFRSDPDAFDLVITDYTMPYKTGVDLAKEVLELRADIPVVLCTGYSDTIDEDTAKMMGIKVLAMKPLDVRTLARLIRSILD